MTCTAVALRLVLAGETEQTLYDAMGALRLFVELGNVVGGALLGELAGLQHLCVAQDGSEGIVQFMRHAGDQLAHGSHFFALQKLFLGMTQGFVGFRVIQEQERIVTCQVIVPGPRIASWA